MTPEQLGHEFEAVTVEESTLQVWAYHITIDFGELLDMNYSIETTVSFRE